MMLHIRKTIAALSIGALLSACGGGGSSTNTTLTSFPIQVAMQTFFTTGFTSHTLNASGTATESSVKYPIASGTGEIITIGAAVASTTFTWGGTSLQSSFSIAPSAAVTTSVGSTTPSATGTYYFNSSYQPTGYIDNNGNYCKAQIPGFYPTTLTAMQSGTIVTYNCYANYSAGVLSVPSGTQELNYATFPGSSSTILNFVITNTTYNASNPSQIASTVTQTFAIPISGAASIIQTESQFTAGNLSWDITFQ